MRDPNDRELIIKLALECTGYDRTKRFARLISQAQTGQEAIKLARIFETAIREEIEARLKGETMAPNPYTDSRESRPKYAEGHAEAAPAQAREEEALSSRKLAEGIVDSVIGAFKKYYPCRPDERIALIDAIEAAIDKHDAALRSRQSLQAAVEYDIEYLTQKMAEELKRVYPEIEGASDLKFVLRRAFKLAAAAPQPSPQGEDAEALVEELVSIAYDANMKTDTGFRRMKCKIRDALRARLASAQSSAQGEEARGMREAIDAIADNSTPDEMGENADEFSRDDWMDAYKLCVERAREARAALERKETK